MTAATFTPTTAEPAARAPGAIPGMDGIVRLAARVAGAAAASVVLGAGDDRRLAASTAGPEPGAEPSLVAPLLTAEGEVQGALEVFGAAHDDEATRELLHDLAAQAVALVALQRAATDLARAETRDPLTGLPNRRAAEQALGIAIRRAERGLGTPSVVVIDLDNFADVNATHGPHVGDAVLRAVAERLARTARAVDTVARLGGDQFLVVLEHTGGPGAAAALSRLRQALDTGWSAAPEAGGVTVGASLGITTYRPGDGVASMIARADAEMYADKAGRRG